MVMVCVRPGSLVGYINETVSFISARGRVRLSLPEGRSINPVNGRDREGVGVKPDHIVPAETALGRAWSLANGAIAGSRLGIGTDQIIFGDETAA